MEVAESKTLFETEAEAEIGKKVVAFRVSDELHMKVKKVAAGRGQTVRHLMLGQLDKLLKKEV